MLQSATALVGRDAELSRLGELLDAAAKGHGGGAVLLGEAGIGKTAVAAVAATAAESRGFTVVWGRCPELSPSPYWPWRQLLAGLSPNRLVDDVKLGSRAELFASVLTTLEQHAADGPLALFLDDVHRADEGSLELLAFVASQLQGTPIVLVATSRDDALELSGPAGSALAGLPLNVLRLELAGLDPEQTTVLVRALNRSASDELVANIQRRTAGNPFFVSEVARLYATRQRQGADAGIEVPKAVQHVLNRRFARLGQDAVGMLEVAAVIGEPDVHMLAEVTGRSEAEVLELLDEPMQARLLARTGRELRFAHDLVREALYAGLSEPTRARLHRSIADVTPDSEPVALAEHWARALGPEARIRAAQHALAAAEEASAALAHEQAVRYFEWALADGAGDQIAVRIGLGQSQVLAGEVDAGRETLRQAAAVANAEGRPADAVRAVLAMGSGVGGFEVDIGDGSQEHLLTSALAALPEDDLVTRAAGLARLSVARTPVATPEERATQAREALSLAAVSGDSTVEAAALAALNDAIAGPDHVADRLEGADRIIAIANRESDTALALLGLRMRLVARLESGDVIGVDHDIAEYDLRAQRLRLPIYSWPVPLWRGMRAAMVGDHETAAACADEVDRFGREAGSTNATMMAWTLRLQQAKATGSPVAFASLLEEIAPWSVEPSQWDCCLASIYAYSGALDKARYHLDRITTGGLDTIPKDSEWIELMWQLAEAALILTDRKVAEAIRDRLTPYADQWAVDGMGGACFGPVSNLLTRLDDILERPGHGAGPKQPELIESAELRREGRVWLVAFRGRQATISHSKGMTDLATLVARPGREIHVLDLIEAGGGPSRAEAGSSTGPVLDRQARASYKARLVDLEDEIDTASADSDTGRVDTLIAERDFLLAELSGALGLSGRDRVTGDRAERARKAVKMRITTAQKAIAEAHPELAQHLRLSVSTGRFCCYRPEQPVDWRT